MSVEPIESLTNKIMDRYNRKSEGWAVLTDYKGNVLVLGPRVGYRLKLIPLNPYEYTGVGIEIGGLEEMRRVVEGIPSYGFRPLSAGETEELFNAVHRDDVIQNKLIKKLLGMKPVPPGELQKEGLKAILSGPVIAHPDLNAISKSQRELDVRLATEAAKLFREKYPHRAAIYR